MYMNEEAISFFIVVDVFNHFFRSISLGISLKFFVLLILLLFEIDNHFLVRFIFFCHSNILYVYHFI